MRHLISFFIFIAVVGVVFADGKIEISYSPYTIHQSGSYVVVKSLSVSQNLNCITIDTSDITLDLNGNTLYGPGTTEGTKGSGIYAGPDSVNITITNGIIQNFHENGIILKGKNCHISKIKTLHNGWNGIELNSSAFLTQNICQENGKNGIYVEREANIQNNNCSDNGETGIIANYSSVVTDNIVTGNYNFGIFADHSSTIVGNVATKNIRSGIFAGINCTVTGNSVSENEENGIHAYLGNCSILHNVSSKNNGDGINVMNGSTVKDNTVSTNLGAGIRAIESCQVIGNTCKHNGFGSSTSAGIEAEYFENVIENNTLVENAIGLRIGQSGNYYAGNRAGLNLYKNYSIVKGNRDGGKTSPTLRNISFYTQSNLPVQSFAGYDIPLLRDSPDGIVRDLIW